MPEGANTDLTVGETYRNLIALRGDFNRLTAKLDERPDWQDMKRVENSLTNMHDADTKTQAKQIDELQDANKWSMRLTITTMLGLLVNIIYTSAQATGVS